jgi:hypothetical protein
MKPAEQKLIDNNYDLIISMLNGLRIVRENGGFGSVSIKVKDSLVLHVITQIEEHIH